MFQRHQYVNGALKEVQCGIFLSPNCWVVIKEANLQFSDTYSIMEYIWNTIRIIFFKILKGYQGHNNH